MKTSESPIKNNTNAEVRLPYAHMGTWSYVVLEHVCTIRRCLGYNNKAGYGVRAYSGIDWTGLLEDDDR